MIAWTRRLTQTLSIIATALAVTTVTHDADARVSGRSGVSHAQAGRGHARIILSGMVYRSYGGGRLQCVPFARENSGIELAGNAANWWSAANGVYERGARPEVGSVLNFRANGRMRMGHVAVVSNVVDSRNVEIDHANWSGRGAIGRNVRVVDVSAANDWSAVRVALSQGDYGSVYPTYGFIYDRPDRGTMVANNGVASGQGLVIAAPIPMLAAARDFRAPADRIQLAPAEEQEVAEASDEFVGQSRYSRAGVSHAGRTHAAGHSYASASHASARLHERRSPTPVVSVASHHTRVAQAVPAKRRRS